MNRHVDVIDILRNVNPVPPGTAEDQPPAVDEDFGSLLGRNDAMSSTITKPETRVQARPNWPKYLAAVAGVIVIVAVVVPMTLPVASEVDWGEVPADQRAVVEQVVQATNEGDATEFASAFAPGGTFTTHIQFDMRSACCDSYPVDESDRVQTWMSVGEIWGLEADLKACQTEGAQSVRCQVNTRWENLQMELGEEWLFVFDGSDLRAWGMLFQQPDPPDRAMPMSYDDLGAWQEWLEANQPELAGRLLVQARTFGDFSIDGVPYESNILRFDPALADEIRVSIEEYVASR